MTIYTSAARNSTRAERIHNHDFVAHLHRLGPDILAQFLIEIADELDLTIELERYGRLDLETIRALRCCT